MKVKSQLHEREKKWDEKGGNKRQTKKPWFYWFLFNFLWLNMQLRFGGNSFNYLFMGSQRSVSAELKHRRMGNKPKFASLHWKWNQKLWLLITRNWIKQLTQFVYSTVDQSNVTLAWITHCSVHLRAISAFKEIQNFVIEWKFCDSIQKTHTMQRNKVKRKNNLNHNHNWISFLFPPNQTIMKCTLLVLQKRIHSLRQCVASLFVYFSRGE